MANINTQIEDKLIDEFNLMDQGMFEPQSSTYFEMKDYVPSERPEGSTEGLHNLLEKAGWTPGYGNIADSANALLYLLEGEWGDAAWSAGMAIPIMGQFISAKKALKAARESGIEMVTVFRGYNKWHKGKMVKEGNFVGGGGSAVGARTGMFKDVPPGGSLYVTDNLKFAKEYAMKDINIAKNQLAFLKHSKLVPKKQKELAEFIKNTKSGPVLEFQIPKPIFDKISIKSRRISIERDPNISGTSYAIPDGLSKYFLTKVH